jgi:hypothetical protein
MRRVTLIVRSGPMEGARVDSSLGRLTLGRSPGPHGFVLTGDEQVSRHHGELALENDRVTYRNLSPNGSQLDGQPVEDAVTVTPGGLLEIGSHRIELRFDPTATQVRDPEHDGPLWRTGLLARPGVRAGLVVYLALLASLVLLATGSGADDVGALWEEARSSYLTEYHPEELGEEDRAERLEEAERLVDLLVTLERRERWDEARLVCRRLMAIDRDPASPVYRFAAKRLGALSEER